MRRATAKSTERSSATEPGFQCRLGLPSAWSQPETRRTTLVRSHSHTSATSPIPLLPRVPRSLAYRSMLLSRSHRLSSSLLSFSRLPYRARFRDFFGALKPPDESWSPLRAHTASCRQLQNSIRDLFFALCSERVYFFAIQLLFDINDESTWLRLLY